MVETGRSFQASDHGHCFLIDVVVEGDMPDEAVTLVIPCLNDADTLPEVLRSVNRLSPAPDRVLCVYDRSTDRTKEIIQDHDRAELIERHSKDGIAAARNTGLEHTETPWLAMIDADIRVHPNWLGTMYDVCLSEDVALVQGTYTNEITTSGDWWRQQHVRHPYHEAPFRNRAVDGSNILARTDALRAVGGWDEQYHITYEDHDLMNRLVDAGYDIYCTPKVETVHLRTDTWLEALRRAWEYHHGSWGRPTDLSDVAENVPHNIMAGTMALHDLYHGRYGIFWISAIRPFVHIWWDLEHAIRLLRR